MLFKNKQKLSSLHKDTNPDSKMSDVKLLDAESSVVMRKNYSSFLFTDTFISVS